MISLLQNTVSLSGTVNWDWVFFGAFLLLMVAIVLYSLAIPQGGKRWWTLALLLGAFVLAGMAVGEGTLRVVFLDIAAFLAVALVWIADCPKAKVAARRYLILMVIAMAFIASGLILVEGGTPLAPPLDKIAAALLIVGFSLKLAFVPFYFWLPGVAEHSKPMTTALIAAVVDIAAFTELVHLRLNAGWVFENYATLWLVLALLSMFGGAILALAQKNIKRMLAFSTIDDMGYLLLGTLVGTQAGLSGALLAALGHAFFKVMLFAAVGVAENKNGHDLTIEDHGMAARYPVSAAAFIAGALGMIGVPPLFGFLGRWRLYLAGVEFGGWMLVIAMSLATGLALLYYVRVIHLVWLGKPDGEIVKGQEPKLAAFVLVALMVLTLVVGLYPTWLTALFG